MVLDYNSEVVIENDPPIMNEPHLETVLVLQGTSLEITEYRGSWKVVR